MRMTRPLAAALFLAAFAIPARAQVVQERVDLSVVQRIRDEAMNRSQVDSIVGYLTDVIGSRLTGSSGMRRANDWTAQRLRDFGLQNVVVEPWDSAFGRGWERVSYSGRFLEPNVQPLIATPQGWSGSTRDERGRPATITCPVMIVELNDTTDFARYEGRLRGACVLRQAPADIPPEFEPAARRIPLADLFQPPAAPQQRPERTPEQQEQARREAAVNTTLNRWLRTQGIAALLVPSGWTYGILRPGNHPDSRLARDSVFDPYVNLMVAHEHYGQMWRNVRRGVPVRLELNVQNRFLDTDRRAFNTLGDIPGTDKANEFVIIGGHLDSPFPATGATDDGVGVAVMMEAARVLKALNLPLRRTVRVGLWAGEEQGLVGSRVYVRMHREELPRISAYLNIDNGGGRLRGIWDQNNSAVIPIFEQMLFPFRDLGVMAVRHGNTGGTDHLSFDAAGVPGFQFVQDPLEYSIRTHHSTADTYERLVSDDLRQMVAVVAWMAYELANRDDLLPRKPPTPPGEQRRQRP